MIKVGDGVAEVDGSELELRCDFYHLIDELINTGVYESAQEIAKDLSRVAGILNMSNNGRLAMLFKYDVMASMKAESTLMHELDGDLND